MGAYAYEAPSNLSNAVLYWMTTQKKESERRFLLVEQIYLFRCAASTMRRVRLLMLKAWKKLIGWTLVMRFTLDPRYRALSFTKTKS